MITIVEATENDFQTIQAIAHRTWPETFGNIISKEQIAYMLEMMYSIPSLTQQVLEKQHKFILAKENTDYVGYASYEVNYNGLPKTKIHKIYILPSAQGKGIGNLLMERMAEIAKQAQNSILSLNVNRGNPAIKFYEKTGFVKTGQEDIRIGNGFLMEDFIMEKNV